MSCLNSAEGFPDFDKAVFSLWFRIPDASRAAAQEESYLGVFGNKIPLLVFGVEGVMNEQIMGPPVLRTLYHVHAYSGPVYVPDYGAGAEWWDRSKVYDPCGYATGAASPGGYDQVEYFAGRLIYTGKSTKTLPSFIGVDCTNGGMTLVVGFSTGQYGSTEQTFIDTITPGEQYLRRSDTFPLMDPSDPQFWADPTALYIPPGWTWTPWDLSDPGGGGDWLPPGAPAYDPVYDTGGPSDPRTLPSTTTYTTEQVRNANTSGCGFNIYAGLSTDTWHHILVSVDLAGNVIQLAVDDVAYPNWDITGDLSGIGTPKIPAAGLPLGLPATSVYADHIRQVQMAELQVFTGVTLDTSVEENRRAFINARGEPVDPLYGLEKAHGIFGPATPNATPSPPIKLLGKAPDISLTRKASNWSSGVNLGSAKVGFERTGRIRPVTPDPVLGK